MEWETKCYCPPGQRQGHSEEYDAIFCRTCLHWTESPAGYLNRPATAENEPEVKEEENAAT